MGRPVELRAESEKFGKNAAVESPPFARNRLLVRIVRNRLQLGHKQPIAEIELGELQDVVVALLPAAGP